MRKNRGQWAKDDATVLAALGDAGWQDRAPTTQENQNTLVHWPFSDGRGLSVPVNNQAQAHRHSWAWRWNHPNLPETRGQGQEETPPLPLQSMRTTLLALVAAPLAVLASSGSAQAYPWS